MIRFLVYFLLLIGCVSQAQNTIVLDVKKESSGQNKALVDLVVALNNTSEVFFEGSLKITAPEGFKNISGEIMPVAIEKGEALFIPLKLLRQKSAKAGIVTITINVLDKNNKLVTTKEIEQVTEEDNSLSLIAASTTVFLNNVNDSLSIKVAVSNLGNKKQDVFVVFSIPDLVGTENFFEMRGSVEVKKDTVFNFKMLLPNTLINKEQFTVNVAGMRSSEKILFGNTSIAVQNVSSVKRYQSVENSYYAQMNNKNSIAASYRTIGRDSGAYQFLGATEVDLPAGFVSLNGNVYKTDQHQALVSNSYLQYHLNNSSVKIGNVSLLSEMPLFGRGVQVAVADKVSDKSLEVGFIDENFNLIEKNAFLKNNYGMYAVGTLNKSNSSNNLTGSFVYKKDVTEQAQHYLVGLEKQQQFGLNWQGYLKGYGGMSNYLLTDNLKPVFSVETQYSGSLNDLRLSGNYFYSSDFFPGNRRGTLQIQQNFFAKISKNRTIYSNVFFSDFSPQSLTYHTLMHTSNFRFNAGVSIPKTRFVSSSFEYQYSDEKGNNFIGLGADGVLQLKSNRLMQNFNWLSNNQSHSVTIAVEEGLAVLSERIKLQPQLRFNAMYSFKWLNVNAMYQYGSFFLSEYSSVLRMANKQTAFERITFTAAADKTFLQNQLSLKTGVSYVNDFYLGQTPSAFFNLKYIPNTKYQVFLNSSWYQYNSYNAYFSTSKMFVVEAGLVYNFSGTKPSAGRKGMLSALVFFDKNSNNLFDGDDEAAADYYVTINNTTFKTDAKGGFEYRSLPFGSYKINAIAQKGWFSNELECTLDGYDTFVLIPLQQNGTISGKIHYSFDDKRGKSFEVKLEGVVFEIYQNGKFIQRLTTNDDGTFVGFLSTGNYQIEIDENSLPSNTYCEKTVYECTVITGKITQVSSIEIKVREKTINVKKFGF